MASAPLFTGRRGLFYSDDDIAAIVRAIKTQHPECAVTLSIGERSRETYALWKKQAPTVIFCATKRQTVRITPNCIRQN